MNLAADMGHHSGRATPSLHDAPYRQFEEATGRRSTYPLPIPVQTNPATSVLASNEMRDVRRREADIAIRHARPDHPELIGKLVRVSSAHLYAATSYLDLRGRPQTAADLLGMTFIGFAPVDRLIAGLNSCGLALTRSQFKVVTDNGVVAGELIRQGFGIGVMPKEFAGLLSGVEPILPELVALPLPFWLVTHRELLTSRRIRVVYDLLAEAFS